MKQNEEKRHFGDATGVFGYLVRKCWFVGLFHGLQQEAIPLAGRKICKTKTCVRGLIKGPLIPSSMHTLIITPRNIVNLARPSYYNTCGALTISRQLERVLDVEKVSLVMN